MKTLQNIVAVALLSLVTIACKSEKSPEVKTLDTTVEIAKTSTKKLDPNATYAKAEFGISGMTCAMGCAKTIEKKIAKLDGVKSATVNFEKELAMVEYDEAMVTPQTLEEAVAKAGDTYKVKDMKTVTSFSTDKKACKADCTKECCANKVKDGKKMACADDCKMECCVTKA